MNHQRATGRPTQSTIAFAMRGVFMYIGGSLGPPGTLSKYGPVIHRIHTYNWRTRSRAADGRPDLDRLDRGLNVSAERRRSAQRLGDDGRLLLVRQIAHEPEYTN